LVTPTGTNSQRPINPALSSLFSCPSHSSQVLKDAQRDCENDNEKSKLRRMIEDHRKLLYPDCKQGHKKLGTILEMLQWKAKYGVSDKAFERMLKIVKHKLPVRW
jgi:hypothetical protein